MDLVQRIGNWDCPRNLLTLLPNTEAYSQEYRNKFKIQTTMVGTMENEEQDIEVLIDSNKEENVKSIILDNFDFNFTSFNKNLNDYDFCRDILNQYEEKPWLVKNINSKDLIII